MSYIYVKLIGMTKSELFSKNLQDTAAIFKALGHPARLAIINYLANSKTCISGDISKELPLSRTTVNQHLKELKDIQIIRGEIEGVKTNYCLNSDVINQIKKVVENLFIKIDCC